MCHYCWPFVDVAMVENVADIDRNDDEVDEMTMMIEGDYYDYQRIRRDRKRIVQHCHYSRNDDLNESPINDLPFAQREEKLKI